MSERDEPAAAPAPLAAAGEGQGASPNAPAPSLRTGSLPPQRATGIGGAAPPLGRRFQPGRSGNPLGRPKRTLRLGALVAAALRERVAVEAANGRVRRVTKLEATIRQIVDGATQGDARAIKLLFALIKTDERALAEPEPRRPGAREAADALVMAELARRFGGGGKP